MITIYNENERRIPTTTPGVTMVERANGTGLETVREILTTTGEITDEEDDSVTVETVTITRKSLNIIG